jgi:hypothetical protein
MRAGHLALAIALIVVGALGTAALVTAVAADGEYVALGRDVDYGAQLRAEDLVTVRMSTTPGLHPVAASDLDRVVGAYATMPLAAGTLLTPAQVTAEPVPGPGQHVVGITVRGDRLPAQRLRPGDPVLLVATSDRSSNSGDGGDAVDHRPRTWHATVTAVAGGDGGGFLGGGGSGSVTLDVAVPASDGPTVATLAAANRLVVVLAGS